MNRSPARRIWTLTIALTAGCGVNPSPEGADGLGPAKRESVERAAGGPSARSLLVRGRILDDSASLDPVFLLEAAPPSISPEEGGFRVTGRALDGTRLFEHRFEPGEVVAVGELNERHFSVRVPISADDARRLHRVEVRSEDRTAVVSEARFTAGEYEREIASEEALQVDRVAESRVRVRWDVSRSSTVMVMQPRTGEIISFGRGGDIVVSTSEETLEVAFSDGVQSTRRLVRVR